MRSYEEQEKRAYEKAELLIAERDHRKAIIRRSAAFIAGTAAVLAIGISAGALNPPHRPSPESTGIMTEQETSADTADSTVKSAGTSSAVPKKSAAAASQTTETSASVSEQTAVTAETHTAVTTAAAASSAETEPQTEPAESLPPETEEIITTEAAQRTKAPRTTSRLRTIDAAWTEVVPFEPDPNTKKNASLKPFDLDTAYNDTDIIFDGTVIGSAEYEVCMTFENGNSYVNRVTVLDVTVDNVYYGETDKDTVKVLWKAPLAEQASAAWQRPIIVGSEYIFMTQELSEEYPDPSLAYRYADCELLSSRWYLMPVYGDISEIYYEFFKNDEEAQALAIHKEDIIDILPDHTARSNINTFFRKDDLAELLKKLFE